MHLRYSPDTYYRSVAGDSLLWHKRNTACLLMEHAQAFLDELSWEWRDADAIVRKLAELFAMPESEIANDFREFCQPLIANGLVECAQATEGGLAVAAPSATSGFAVAAPPATSDRDDSWTPLGSFFEKHRIPAEFHIDLTSACTERCVHCYIPEYANRFLDFDLAKKALDEYRALGGLTVHLSGGECMLHPQFDDIVRYCRAQNINMIVLSNLTCCDERRLAVLKETDPQFVNVSLYSMDPAKHDAVTCLPGSWRKTMDAILACEKEGVHIRLAAPVLKENREGYGELAKFAREHHMHLIPDVDIFPQCDHDDSNLDHALSAAELAEFLRENRALFPGYANAAMPAPEAKVCDIGKARICLDSQGHYYPCDGTHGLVLGDVRTDTLESVWRGEKFDALRALRNRDFESCVACQNRPYCKVCPAHNFNATGEVLHHSPQKCAFAAVKRQVLGSGG